jgi:hypothetical protein
MRHIFRIGGCFSGDTPPPPPFGLKHFIFNELPAKYSMQKSYKNKRNEFIFIINGLQ